LWVIVFDYCIVSAMDKSKNKRRFLLLSILNVILVLAVFKYSHFIIASINELFYMLEFDYTLPADNMIFPIGVSFFLLVSLGNTMDFYYGRVDKAKSIFDYASFVSFFPSLISGPIERGNRLMPQLTRWPKIKREYIFTGAYLFLCGVFKKAALADYFKLYADSIFGNPSNFASLDLLCGAVAFTWQIYFDFSGYTDMARGIARMLGIDLMENFNLPYIASSTGDFWRRWHISLSSWFRDYLYIPLGGNKKGELKEARNILIAMAVSGLWHGAAWNFIFWGCIHGVIHSAGKFFKKIKFMAAAPVWFKRIFVFIIIVFTWIFFRSSNIFDGFIFVERIFSTNLILPQIPIYMALLILLSYIFQWLKEYKKIEFIENRYFKIIASCFMIIYLLLLVSNGQGEFIYFQF
jgi:D-alanyl-lipoteichoic acid acyltransferase DltB (MBOAT superfamily)